MKDLVEGEEVDRRFGSTMCMSEMIISPPLPPPPRLTSPVGETPLKGESPPPEEGESFTPTDGESLPPDEEGETPRSR